MKHEGRENTMNREAQVKEGAWHFWENADALMGLQWGNKRKGRRVRSGRD